MENFSRLKSYHNNIVCWRNSIINKICQNCCSQFSSLSDFSSRLITLSDEGVFDKKEKVESVGCEYFTVNFKKKFITITKN